MRWLDVDWVGVEMKDKDLWENWEVLFIKEDKSEFVDCDDSLYWYGV